MPDRREILIAGLAGSALPTGLLASAARAAEPQAVRFAVYDDRFDRGRAFGREALARGWPVRAIAGDVTEVWFQDLDPVWKLQPAPVAGVTLRNSLFCLERLAWDAGLRVVSRAELDRTPLVSWLIGSRPRGAA